MISLLISNVCQCGPSLSFSENRGVSPASQLVVLQGIQFIGLGAVMDELTPRERVYDTIEQLTTRTDRIISVGYLLDRESEMEVPGASENSRRVKLKDTETIPLDIWVQNFPKDLNMSYEVKRTIDLVRRNELAVLTQELEKRLAVQKAFPNRANNKFKLGITTHNLAVLNVLAGEDNKAEHLFRKAVSLKASSFGANHPEVALSLGQIGIQQFSQGQFQEALVSFQEAHKIHVASNHPFEAILNNIACCEFQLGNHKKAARTLQEAREIQRKSQVSTAQADLDLLHVATMITNHGYLLLAMKQYEEARALFQEGLLIQESVLSSDHRAVRDTLSNIEFSNAFHS